MNALTPDQPFPDVPLLRKCTEWAEAEAAKTDGTCAWDQSWYAGALECGTAYCIAGFAVIAGVPGARLADGLNLEVDGRAADWFDTGQEVLGLTRDEAYALFRGENTIADVRHVAEQIAARAGDAL